MYDEKIDCKLRTSALVEDRILNWSRINSQICFNFLQQRFYLVEPTMKSLAKGNNSDTIFKLLKVLINTQQADFYEALAGDTSLLKDIADQLEVESPLFGEDESRQGVVYNKGFPDNENEKDY